MTRRWLFGMLVLCGCGRFDFDEKAIEDAQPPEKKAPTLSYPERINAVVGKTKVQIAAQVEGEGVTFSVQPPLPTGVTLDELTGKISGIPETLENLEPHTITATNEGGSASATILFSSLKGNEVDRDIDLRDADQGFDKDCSITNVPGDGCTFRAAYETAIHFVDPTEIEDVDIRRPRVVILPAGIYRLDDAQIGAKRNVVISGAGPGKTIIVSAGGEFGFMKLDGGASLRLENLTISGFRGQDGGALLVPKETLDVFNVAFENNEALLNSGGVICVTGGAAVNIDSSTFTNNKAIANSGWGGVINGSGDGTRITVKRSTASENQAQWGSFAHLETGATLYLESSTLVNNAASAAGTLASPGGHYTVVNSTIVGNRNSSGRSAGIFLYNNTAKYTLRNTILAGNKADSEVNNCSREGTTTGSIVSLGGNVFGDGAGACDTDFQATGDLLTADLKLAAGLADNGGLTKTLAILAGSAAQDRGTSCPKMDQRGAARQEAICDAGAFELPPNPADSL